MERTVDVLERLLLLQIQHKVTRSGVVGCLSFDVVGSRVNGNAQTNALTLQQRFGNWLACKLMNGIWHTCYSDLGPFRAIDAAALKRLAMRDRGYGWTVEMQIKAALLGLKATEVPVSYRPRIGVSKISGTLKGTLLAGTKILGLIGRYALVSLWRGAA